MTTMFCNPGSTELPMLHGFPSDFTYVLGLQEAVVVGMADGYAQASGQPTLVNLHTAPGVGNAMGAIFNAQANKSPLVITAGQQVRAMVTLQANLTNRDATRLPHPFVKWSYEPPRAQDVPLALGRAVHMATLPPRGPVFVSIPMDDWSAEVDEGDVTHAIERKVFGRAGADPEAVRELADRLAAAKNPALVAGPDLDASGAWEAAVALAERQRLPVWATPAPGGGRIGFPEGHPSFRGTLPPAIGPLGQMLEGLVDAVPESDRSMPEPLGPPEAPPESDPLSPSTVHGALGEVLPDDAIVVLESPSSTMALRNQLRLSRPGSYYFGAGGGLGFGLAAAVGVQLAEPNRPVVCVIGEGSVQYAVTAFWSAVAYRVPVTFLVLRNEEYAILKWFADIEQVEGAPGLDLKALDTVEIAAGYGVDSGRVEGLDELRDALSGAIGADRPGLIEVAVAPGMALF